MKKLFLFLMLFSAPITLANEMSKSNDSANNAYNECIDQAINDQKKESVDAGINNGIAGGCMEYSTQLYEEQISKLSKQIIEKYRADKNDFEIETFEQLQKNWEKYRESKCNLIPPGLESMMCLMTEAEARVKKLKTIKEDGDGAYYSIEDF